MNFLMVYSMLPPTPVTPPPKKDKNKIVTSSQDKSKKLYTETEFEAGGSILTS